MRILNLFAENVLNLRAVEITPDGNVVQITGPNGAGKSSVLNAIYYALAGKRVHATKPIRRGADKATVRLRLGDAERELLVSMRITENDSYLDVETTDGARLRSPRQVLEAIYGQLTFDPIGFSRMKPEARLDTLRGLVKLDLDVDKLDQDNARDYELRREWNRKVQSLAERESTLLAGVVATLDIEPIDIESLTEQMAQASEHNAAIDRRRAARATALDDIRKAQEAAAEKQQMAERLLREAEQLRQEAAVVQVALDKSEALPELVDVRELSERINTATKENAHREHQRRQREAHAAAVAELDAARKESERLTRLMADRDETKATAIAAAKMPIDGLGFGDGDVTFNGLPFSQASTGEQLRIATAIGMALNPELRVLCVRDGSLLDRDGRAMLAQMAEEHDFQLWIEATQDDPTFGIHIIDGAVAAVDGVKVAVEETAGV